ncbi:unnamed protein product [Caenorhabditis sp. 36 PRJEB53466]|nr:unnamed protein product [Caenorhabditis sp. 36 PRJEB53466]
MSSNRSTISRIPELSNSESHSTAPSVSKPQKSCKLSIILCIASTVAFLLLLAAVILFFSFSSASPSQALSGNSTTTTTTTTFAPPRHGQNETEQELVFVQIMFRHGARAPGHLKAEHEKHFPRGASQLTDRGFKNSFLMGRYLKKRYVDAGFLNARMNPKEMYWRSRQLDRCLSTAATVGAGMFETGKNKHVQVSIMSREKKDRLLASFGSRCREAHQRILEEKCSETDTNGSNDVYDDNYTYYTCLGRNHSLFNQIPLEDSDTFINLHRNDVPLPPLIEENIKTIHSEYLIVRNFQNGVGESADPRLVKIRFGPLADALLGNLEIAWDEHINGKQTVKFKAYSTQDWIVGGTLEAFGLLHHLQKVVGPEEEPGFNSMIVMELWKKKDKPFVKLLYKQEEVILEGHEMMDLTGIVPNCGKSECPLEKFTRCCDKYRIREKDRSRTFLNQSLTRRHVSMSEEKYDFIWNVFLNCWFVGFFVGIWLSPILNDKFGRKVGFVLGNVTAFLASVLQCLSIFSFCPELLIVSRFVTSICMAVTYQSCILFLQECSPTHLRGNFSFLSEISYSFMTMVGSFLGQDYILGGHVFWLCFFVVPFCLFFTLALFILPETPKFLLISRNAEEEAMKAVKFYHGKQIDGKRVLEDIRKESQCESEESSSTWRKTKELFTEGHLRMALILSVSALQNTIGLWALLLSSTFFLENANVESEVAQWSTTAMSLAYVSGTVTGGIIIEKVGRRTLLLSFTFLNNISLLAFVFFAKIRLLIDPMKYGCLASLIIYGYTYGTGVGPISWFISSELVPQKHRSIAQSVGYAINTLMVVVSTFTVLPLYSVIGSYAFVILYSIPSFISMLILFCYLPETKGREIHEIVNELRSK